MALDNTLAVVFRFGMIFVYGFLYIYFFKGYKKSKESGYKNTYFLGFAILFLILMVFHLLYGTLEFYYNGALNPFDVKGKFPWYIEQGNWIDDLSHQIRPLYLIFYFLMNCVIASQVYPLEQALGWKKAPFSKIIVIFGLTEWLLFIPALSYSYFAVVPIVLGFLGIFIGFVLNIGANIKIYRETTGEIRKRSMRAIFAFLFLGFGLYWSMEVGLGSMINSNISNRWDVVIGSLIQIIGVIFYRFGFKIEDKDKEFFKFLKGDFTQKQLQQWLIIAGVFGVLSMIVAVLFYPEENNYSIWKDTISFLGSSDLDNNPNGWMFLTIAFYIFGIFTIPVNFYRFRRMKEVNKFLAFLCLIFYTIASLGLILTGTFPDNGGLSFIEDLGAGKLHNLISLLAFGGFGAALLFDFFIYVLDRITIFGGKKIFKPIFFAIPYILFFTAVGIGGYFLISWEFVYEELGYNHWPGVGLYAFPFWEWVVLYLVFFMYYWGVLLMNKGINKLRTTELKTTEDEN